MSDKFAIQVTKAAEKDLDGPEPYRKRVVSELRALEGDPHKGHAFHGKLREYRALEFFFPVVYAGQCIKSRRTQRFCTGCRRIS